MTDGRVDWHLWNWTRWQRKSRSHHLGYPSRAAVGENYSSGWDFDAQYDSMTDDVASAVDVVIDGLPKDHKAAIYANHLGGPWMLPDVARGIYYRDAFQMVGKGLSQKGVE